MKYKLCMLLSVFLLVAFYMYVHAEDETNQVSAHQHNQWIAKVLKEIQTVNIGMTRISLLKVFTTQGGISNRHQRTYVHKECPYIKVDVEFKSVGNKQDKLKELPKDVIVKISRPYLQWSIKD